MTANAPIPADNPASDMERARAAFLAARKRKAEARKQARQTSQTPSRVTNVTSVTHATTPGQIPSANPSEPVRNPSVMVQTHKRPGPRNDNPARRDNRPGYGKAPPDNPDNIGRPIVFTEEIALLWQTRIIEHLMNGRSLSSFCNEHLDGPARTTVLDWRREYPMFRDSYTHAREDGADALADGVIDVADSVKDAGPTDSARVNAARLMVDARKWSASKLKPGAYADRLETHVTGNVAHTVKLDDDQRAKALASIMARQAIGQSSSLPDALRRIADGSAKPVTLDGMTGEPVADE